MEFKLVKQESMTFTGFSKTLSSDEGKNYQEIAMFWGDLFQNGKHGLLLPNQDELGVVGVTYDWSNINKTYKYMTGIRNDVEIPEAKKLSFLPATYAVFTVVGPCPRSIQDVVNYIHNEFLPNGIYQHTGGPEIEVYPAGNAQEKDYVCYYWLPVVEK